MADTTSPIPDRDIPRQAEDLASEAVLGRYASGSGPPPDDPLEAERVRQVLADRTANVYAAERAAVLDPLDGYEVVADRLALAGAVARETAEGRALPRLHLPEIREALARARIEDAVLEAEELAAVHRFLGVAGEVETAAAEVEEPRLADFLGDFARPDELVRHLDRVVDPAGGIRDQASDELAGARAEVRRARERVRSHLEERANSRGLRPHLRDSRITLRQGRYVLAVKAESQGHVKGVVHAASGSGETVFMEPLEAVHLNNGLERAEAEAQRAEHRVRVQATKAVARARQDLIEAADFLGLLDLLRAGEALRGDLGGSVPELGEGPAFALEGAAHPLLVLDHGPDQVVPGDLSLGGDARCLVISGPNTGGKTVLLKTVGLAHWMAYCGLPVAGSGTVGWFDDVWAVIGDQQSLQADLSTFSAQLVRLKGVLAGVDDRRLVLIDELGSGTNPNEGSALGIAVLERLRQSGAVALVSTHLDRLKHYAVAHDGVVNAALAFDVERLEPTYRLEWAQAGRSQALEIAARLGLPEDLIESAREALGEEALEVERLLNERDRLLAEADSDRAGAAEARERAEAADREAAELRAQLEAERHQAYGEASAAWAETLEEAREEVRAVIRRLKETGNTAEADAALRELDKRFRGTGESAPAEQGTGAAVKADQEVQVGDKGRLAPFRKAGEVVAVDSERDEIEMDLAGKRVRGELANFQRTQRAEPATQAESAGAVQRAPATPATTEIDLRGMRREEALAAFQHFLDNAYRAGLRQATVLHGKGTGVLSEAVHQALAAEPRVARYGHARPEAGGAGVTEVEFTGGQNAS
ncbi:endonuclease MutS2 [Thiohalorhabdus sp.]|uniref:endonuclease MutS2 n=1 Tax=Thiohalorhabdus sp. TaxID=3094134 RepID=UPI002FC3A975